MVGVPVPPLTTTTTTTTTFTTTITTNNNCTHRCYHHHHHYHHHYYHPRFLLFQGHEYGSVCRATVPPLKAVLSPHDILWVPGRHKLRTLEHEPPLNSIKGGGAVRLGSGWAAGHPAALPKKKLDTSHRRATFMPAMDCTQSRRDRPRSQRDRRQSHRDCVQSQSNLSRSLGDGRRLLMLVLEERDTRNGDRRCLFS
ncbi:hypothetical protein E2C01_036561 [Portunus trituberculatus]|uniref:Uncharacterized protein n=1 Tax=Portunus trituberculatus TaxID=210409 RepID=A0A5B7FBH8_PORTR|nr:hypothetical protein [Portunus trituberculatus]